MSEQIYRKENGCLLLIRWQAGKRESPHEIAYVVNGCYNMHSVDGDKRFIHYLPDPSNCAEYVCEAPHGNGYNEILDNYRRLSSELAAGFLRG
jgi:hypothetical protein